MRTTRFVALVLSGVGLLSACSDTTPIETTAPDGARIVRVDSGALTAPSSDAPDAIVRDFLRTRGAAPAIDGLRVTQHSAPRDGISHVRMEQVVDGVRVYGAYVKAALSERGELVHLIERVFAVTGRLAAPAIDERAALQAAMRHLGYDVKRRFHREPTVERVAFADELGMLRPGFLVETWTARDNLLDHTLVDGAGTVVSVEHRTNTDRYNVFSEDPGKNTQEVIDGDGWISGAQSTVNIAGNNANAYLDVDANNIIDAGGTPVTDGNFLTAAALGSAPSTVGNRAVAVQNLFYQNNVLHDVLYAAGFDEAHGNFQADNFGRGGAGNDRVKAEAQDGSGTDNANFATPPDGSAPRMQMYLWSSANPDSLVSINGGTAIDAYGSTFGPATSAAGVTGALTLYNAKKNPKTDGCSANSGSLAGRVALIDRGTCDFTTKVLNAQKAGAIGAIVANVVSAADPVDHAFPMGGANPAITIPSVMVTQAQGNVLRTQLGQSAKVFADAIPSIQIDASLDSDIVFHEYGHGLTWRMIGGMQGPYAGAIGEGASDTLAFLLNGDDRIGEYSFSDPNGIRRNPYADSTFSYADVTGEFVHDDGEIYAAAMWRVLELYLANGLTAQDLLNDFVQGMNHTPSGPSFEHMRDGMLQAITDPARECWVWTGFAAHGIGAGASGTIGRRGRLAITESFTVPAGACP